MLFVGDLSYADNYPFHNNIRWDTWGRFIERSAAYQPWIWTAGNHELDFVPEIVSILFITIWIMTVSKHVFLNILPNRFSLEDLRIHGLIENFLEEKRHYVKYINFIGTMITNLSSSHLFFLVITG